MFSTSVFISVLTITISFLFGFLFYLVMIEDTWKVKLKRIETVLSQLINFIIYMWIGKILFKFTTFIKDTLAVLAYPSNSTTFYIATVFIFIHIFVKIRSHKDKGILLQTFIPVFIVAMFMYEFIQAIGFGLKPNWILLAFYMTLIILYTILRDKVTEKVLQQIIVFVWLVGYIGMEIFSVSSLFGYSLGIVYYIGLLILGLYLFVYSNKRDLIKK